MARKTYRMVVSLVRLGLGCRMEPFLVVKEADGTRIGWRKRSANGEIPSDLRPRLREWDDRDSLFTLLVYSSKEIGNKSKEKAVSPQTVELDSSSSPPPISSSPLPPKTLKPKFEPRLSTYRNDDPTPRTP